MTTTERPFSAKHYSLVSCELRFLDDPCARLSSKVLAFRDPWLRLGYTEDGLFRYLAGSDPSLNRYAVVVSEETAGVVCVRYPWLRGPYLELLAVFPSHQGKGLGREILEWMSHECCRISNNIWTTVSSFNNRALSFYKGVGFVEIAVLTDLVAVGFGEILLQKKC
ncbi:MAG: GNAT family N-acetyltransferase [Deltaproteobacteria bacterium]|nr:GNAT family N-acetyltransferase [Deltaproteobacteria bacterium]